MKGLILTTTIIAALIGASFVIIVIINNDFNNRLAAAHERGYEEGHTQGYQEGLREGGKVGYQEGIKIGYEKGDRGDYDSSDGTGSYFIYNPTYDEVREILSDGEIIFAEEILDYADANGIRVAYVRCKIGRQAAKGTVYIYELVAFETVDNGLIIIEPWSHREVRIEAGQSYSELNGLPAPSYDDTITEITIVW